VTYELYLADGFNNVPAFETAVTVTSDSCDVQQSEAEVDNTGQTGAYRILLFFSPDTENTDPTSGTVDIEVEGSILKTPCVDPPF